MSAFKGDFLGFTYGGVHSSDLGIVRTSDGSRFNENLLPTQQNRTVNIPGRDETFYFGSDSTQKQFNIQFAFDSVDDDKLNQIRAWLGNKTVRDLVFDERDTITWRAKVTSSSIKYVPFDGKDGGSIYKGEGSIQFTCYEPWGIQRIEINKNSNSSNSQLNLGALPADWELYIPFVKVDGELKIDAKVTISGQSFSIDAAPLASDTTSDVGIVISSKSGYVQGYYNNYQKSENLYVNCLSNNVSKITVGEKISCEIDGTYGESWKLVCSCKYY